MFSIKHLVRTHCLLVASRNARSCHSFCMLAHSTGLCICDTSDVSFLFLLRLVMWCSNTSLPSLLFGFALYFTVSIFFIFSPLGMVQGIDLLHLHALSCATCSYSSICPFSHSFLWGVFFSYFCRCSGTQSTMSLTRTGSCPWSSFVA